MTSRSSLLLALVSLSLALALAAATAGCLPPDAPPRAPEVDRDTADVVHAWRVDTHLLAKGSPLTAIEAARFHGRAVSIGVTGYSSPWQGTCEESGRTGRERPLSEVAAQLGLDRARVAGLGFTDPLVEYRLSCLDLRPAPLLTLYVAGSRALTCYGGACYVLTHGRRRSSHNKFKYLSVQ